MTLKALKDYTFVAKYARYNEKERRRETWVEAVNRVKDMHIRRYPQIQEEIEWAFDLVKQKRVLGSQRALQFGGSGVEKNHLRSYNCSFSYCDRIRFFQEYFYVLLCGAGAGFSVQKHHIDKLPKLHVSCFSSCAEYQIEDSIEAWADAVGVLFSSFLSEKDAIFPEYSCDKIGKVFFDFSQIRPKGSKLSTSNGLAPGPEPLKKALEIIHNILWKAACRDGKLTPIECYDISMHLSDAVLSGGVRRSSSICLFSKDDEEMMNAKTGNWFYDNPQRARSNNSSLLLKSDTSFEDFNRLFEINKQFGEPGVFWASSIEDGTNPCQPAWAKVLTANGIREFQHISVGTQIWSKEGWTTVTKKWSTGTNEVYKFTTTAGIFYGTECHRLVSHGNKIEAKDCDDIDIIVGPNIQNIEHNLNAIMDGLLIGDGSVHEASNNLIYLCIGDDDQDYFTSEIKDLIKKYRPGLNPKAYEVETYLHYSELPRTFERKIPVQYISAKQNIVKSFLRGLYSANGSICGKRVTLKSSSLQLIEEVQMLLSSIGIRSYYTTNKTNEVEFSNGKYVCKQSYDLNISSDRDIFYKEIGFLQKYKMDKLDQIITTTLSGKSKSTYEIISKELVSIEETFDITVDNLSHTYWTQGCNVSNCGEISFYAYDKDGNSGWGLCNLSEINGKKANTKEKFLEVCRAAAIIGTLQAGYTDFPYLGKTTEEIVRGESLLGISITGVMENTHILCNKEIIDEAITIIKETNKDIASKIGINQSARLTCLKPAGTTSCLLGTSSGIHPHHAKRYFRRVQANDMEKPAQFFESINPKAVESSVWSSTKLDKVITFCIEVEDGAKTKNDVDAIQLLQYVKFMKENWVDQGTNIDNCYRPWLRHNVSNTINVKDNEWQDVAEYIYNNRQFFTGVAVLPQTGDLDYPQAPFCAIHTPKELLTKYGEALLYCAPLIEEALTLWGGNLWDACNSIFMEELENDTNKKDWILKVQTFSFSHNIDVKQTTYILKELYNWQQWKKLKDSYKEVNYTEMLENEDNTKPEETVACSAGACNII